MAKTKKITKTINYAGFWPRFGAHILDSLLEAFIPGIVFISGLFFTDVNPGAGLGIMLLAILLYLAIIILNELVMVAKAGHSLGKKAVGLRVQDKAGEKLSYGMALVRVLIKRGCFFFGVIGALVYTIPLLADSKEKKSLGDIVAGSFIVIEK